MTSTRRRVSYSNSRERRDEKALPYEESSTRPDNHREGQRVRNAEEGYAESPKVQDDGDEVKGMNSVEELGHINHRPYLPVPGKRVVPPFALLLIAP